MATPRHVWDDATPIESDDVTVPKRAVPADDVTECAAYNGVISTADNALTEESCGALRRNVPGQ